MPKIDYYHRWSDLDNQHEFAVARNEEQDCGVAYFAWVFYYLGVCFRSKRKDVYLLPFKPYNWGKPIKTFNINGADKVARLIYNRIEKTLNIV